MRAEAVRALNLTRSTTLCEQIETARGLARSRGLIGRERLGQGAGMLFEAGALEPFMMMHMFFMRFPIDIVFLDGGGRVIKVSRALKPWRICTPVWRARTAIELASGAVLQSRTAIGDQIVFEAHSVEPLII
ncbi:MAG: DUF192 domain-containing protein [Candidatus Binataceae bacterium]